MRFYLTLALCIILTSCSKKTHISDNVQTFSKFHETNDSLGKRSLLSIDKSVTTTSIDLDTSISITGKPLLGNLNLKDSARRFENEDLVIDFSRDKSGFNIAFKASPKTKVVAARYHQKSVTENNILKTDDSQVSNLKKTNVQHDSTYNHIKDLREPMGVMSNLKSTIVWIIISLLTIVIGFFILKRKLLRF